MPLTLVILAAGLGARFGGDKPLAEVGPDGQSLFEYSVYDAVQAGFEHIVFVVSEQQDTSVFADRLVAYDDVKIDFVVQSITAFIKPETVKRCAGRKKPWGTAHALLVCRHTIPNPFVVINADDYHGRENYKTVGQYLLANQHERNTCVLPAYPLANTLSQAGGVNRGVCSVDAAGSLESIQEVTNIALSQSGTITSDRSDTDHALSPDALVSMTCWGFLPSIFDFIERKFQAFVNHTANLLEDEFYIPNAINQGVKDGQLRVKVYKTSETWKGITYATDVPDVRTYIKALTESGFYNGVGQNQTRTH